MPFYATDSTALVYSLDPWQSCGEANPACEPQSTFKDGDIISITRNSFVDHTKLFVEGDMGQLLHDRDRDWHMADFSGFINKVGHGIYTVCNNDDTWRHYRYRHATNREIQERSR